MTLKRYLALLATDVGRLAEFFSNPSAASEAAGISKEDRAALFSGDQNTLYAALTRADQGSNSHE